MATTPQTNATLKGIAETLRAHDDIVICGHTSPDGDCLGSQLALWHTLKALGKRATCVLVKDEAIPFAFAFLPGADEMVPASSYTGEIGLFVGVDVPTRERIGEAACALLDRAPRSATIDHHASDTVMCDEVYVDPDSASASILVWDVCKMIMEAPPIESALCAYTGLLTDTGGFCFQNTDPHALSVASELVGRGVEPAKVASEVFQSRSLASIELERVLISRMRILADGAVAFAWIAKEDMQRAGAEKADTELLIDVLRSIRGVRVACLLREQDDFVRGSIRAKDDTDVSALARELNGGGHRAAAGFTVYDSLDGAVEMLPGMLVALVSDDADAESPMRERASETRAMES